MQGEGHGRLVQKNHMHMYDYGQIPQSTDADAITKNLFLAFLMNADKKKKEKKGPLSTEFSSLIN
jgi:hypothetical protein